ncbi:hypothetical protein ASD11_03235 [Aeromicrobium sp. Root495]|uniref:fluoride efflux transporter FluC n=1 Tax=Aeromicrobium sp. Root495 TaxID=1736550 RepID=UPI0006F89BE6|nr:CrcB family protein [Aeromicrobium sp. Root495]KQY58679.1 hypothetical protein ASD11_03235 [Aeromicrobium sp. Root495]
MSTDPRSLPHHRPRLLVLVLLGGTAGTSVRHATAEVVPVWHDVPVGTLAVNLVGAFLLGVLLEALVLRGADVGQRRDVRLLLGTGFLGGLTTYSTFALESQRLLDGGPAGVGLAYAVGTVVAGLLLAAAGVASARRWRP